MLPKHYRGNGSKIFLIQNAPLKEGVKVMPSFAFYSNPVFIFNEENYLCFYTKMPLLVDDVVAILKAENKIHVDASQVMCTNFDEKTFGGNMRKLSKEDKEEINHEPVTFYIWRIPPSYQDDILSLVYGLGSRVKAEYNSFYVKVMTDVRGAKSLVPLLKLFDVGIELTRSEIPAVYVEDISDSISDENVPKYFTKNFDGIIQIRRETNNGHDRTYSFEFESKEKADDFLAEYQDLLISDKLLNLKPMINDEDFETSKKTEINIVDLDISQLERKEFREEIEGKYGPIYHLRLWKGNGDDTTKISNQTEVTAPENENTTTKKGKNAKRRKNKGKGKTAAPTPTTASTSETATTVETEKNDDDAEHQTPNPDDKCSANIIFVNYRDGMKMIHDKNYKVSFVRTKIWMFNLPPNTTEDEILEFFRPHNLVPISIKVCTQEPNKTWWAIIQFDPMKLADVDKAAEILKLESEENMIGSLIPFGYIPYHGGTYSRQIIYRKKCIQFIRSKSSIFIEGTKNVSMQQILDLLESNGLSELSLVFIFPEKNEDENENENNNNKNSGFVNGDFEVTVVTFKDESVKQRALRTLEGESIDGKDIEVKEFEKDVLKRKIYFPRKNLPSE